MAPVRRLRSLAWINARKLPGVRCSTLNTEHKSLLCLMTMPGRIWVAGIAITKLLLVWIREWLPIAGKRRAGESLILTDARTAIPGSSSHFHRLIPRIGQRLRACEIPNED